MSYIQSDKGNERQQLPIFSSYPMQVPEGRRQTLKKKGGRLREPKIYLKILNRPVDIFQISPSSSSSFWSQLLSLTLSLCLYHSLRGTVSSVAAIGKRLQRDRRVKEIAGVMETDLSHPKKEFTVHHKKRKRRRRQRDLYLLQSNFLFDSAQYHTAITS